MISLKKLIKRRRKQPKGYRDIKKAEGAIGLISNNNNQKRARRDTIRVAIIDNLLRRFMSHVFI